VTFEDPDAWRMGRIDAAGVWMPPAVMTRNAVTRARYKVKRGLTLLKEEADALRELANRQAARKAAKKRETMDRKEAKRRERARLAALGYPQTAKSKERLEKILKMELEEGVIEREDQAKVLGISRVQLFRFLEKHERAYFDRLEAWFRAKSKRIEESLARERLDSMERALRMNKEADKAIAEALSPDSSISVRLKASKVVKDQLGISREDMREDVRLNMQQEKNKAVVDTLNLLAAKGRLTLAAQNPPDIPTVAELEEDE